MTAFFPGRVGVALPAAIAVAVLSVGAARAASLAPEPTSILVNLGGLDLATPDGQAAVRLRLREAAVRVCEAPDIRDLRASLAFEA